MSDHLTRIPKGGGDPRGGAALALAGMAPPNDIATEAAVLAACLFDEGHIDVVLEHVTPEAFYSEAHRRIFEAILDVREAKKPIDMITVGSRLRDMGRIEQVGGMAYLTEIISIPVTERNVASYARTVAVKSRKRLLIAAMQRRVAELYVDADATSADEVEAFSTFGADTITELNGVLDGLGRKDTFKTFRECALEFHAAITNVAKSGPFSTGWETVDQALGGMHASDLTVVAARPGMGKTAFAIGLATSVAEGRRVGLAALDRQDDRASHVLVYSLEMPGAQLVGRELAADAGVPLNRLRSGRASSDDWSRLVRSAGHVMKYRIHIDDRPGLLITEIANSAKRKAAQLAREGGVVGAIVIDYIQLIRGNVSKNGNREQEIADITRRLKGLAKELKTSVVALSQLSREVEKRSDKRPMISDLRESGAIEQDADNIIFLYRDDYYNRSSAPTNTAEVIIAKQRNGEANQFVELRWDGERTRFFDKDPSDRGERYFDD